MFWRNKETRVECEYILTFSGQIFLPKVPSATSTKNSFRIEKCSFPFPLLFSYLFLLFHERTTWNVAIFSLFELTIRKLLWVWRDQPVLAPVKCFLFDFSCSRKWLSGLPQAGMPVLSDHSQPQDPKLLPNVYYIGCAFLQIPFTFCCDCPKAFL